MTTDPVLPGAVLADTDADPHWLSELRDTAAKQASRIPARYADATVTHPDVATWVHALVDIVRRERRTVPRIVTGPSLLLVGGTGSGKTHAAYGAIRAIGSSGAGCSWLVTTAADLYGALRPRPKVDSEDEFDRYARAGLLVLDDLGAAKGTEWNEEINYRLVNYRYERQLPTIVTTNVPPKNLQAALGERVASRLVEMAQRVVLQGPDRRLAAKGSAA
jgi:DNA replication protein DnaC